MLVEAIAQVASGEAPKDMEEIPNLDDIGDASQGLTAVIGGVPPLRMDVVLFRRGSRGASVWSMYFDGDTPLVSIGDAARKLDFA